MELEKQIKIFSEFRGYLPRVIDTLPIGEEQTLENWKRYALEISERECYSYALFKLKEERLMLLRACEQDFFRLFAGSGWFLRPVGCYLGSTQLGWTVGHYPNQMRWFFAQWRVDTPCRENEIDKETEERGLPV